MHASDQYRMWRRTVGRLPKKSGQNFYLIIVKVVHCCLNWTSCSGWQTRASHTSACALSINLVEKLWLCRPARRRIVTYTGLERCSVFRFCMLSFIVHWWLPANFNTVYFFLFGAKLKSSGHFCDKLTLRYEIWCGVRNAKSVLEENLQLSSWW